VIDMGSGYPAAYRNGAGTGFQGSSRTSALEAAVAETQRQQAAKALNDAIAENERAGRAHKDPVSGAFRGKYGGGRGALGNPKAPGGAKLPFSGPLRAAQSAVSLYQKGRQAWDVEGGPTPISGWELVPGGCPPTAYVCGPEFGPGASACLSGQAGDCGDVGTLDGCSLDMSAIFHEDWPPHIGSHVRHYACIIDAVFLMGRVVFSILRGRCQWTLYRASGRHANRFSGLPPVRVVVLRLTLHRAVVRRRSRSGKVVRLQTRKEIPSDGPV